MDIKNTQKIIIKDLKVDFCLFLANILAF